MASPEALSRAAAADEALAGAAEQEPLDPDVRALGSAIRAYGLADAAGDERALSAARGEAAAAAAQAMKLGEEGVLRLRAYQLRAFLREVRRWEATGEETSELRALGGGFLAMLRRNGWCVEAPRRRVLMNDAAQRAAWKRRFSEVTGLTSPSRASLFHPTLDEQRAFYRFVLARPIDPAAPLFSDDAGRIRAYHDEYRLKKIDELAGLDPSYPAELARGIVLYRLGRYLPAVQAFRRHLDASPDGPFTLRARNYLRAALARAEEP
jgi:tetratricopeptide (TPR) repeat protein